MDLWRCGRIRCMPPPGSARVIQECAFLFSNHTIGTNGPSELPCTQLHHIENKEMHIHQQNHWKDMLFYWYQSYHWYQWTIGIALYPARPHEKSPLKVSIFRWLSKPHQFFFFFCTTGTNGPLELPCTQQDHMRKVPLRYQFLDD